jgi:ATP-binding protein involved in chromosome partitioning
VPLDEEAVRAALRGVIDPELGDNLVDLGMIRAVSVQDDTVTVTVALTVAGCPLRTQLRNDVITRVGALEGASKVVVEMGTMDADERSALMARARWKARESAPVTQIPGNTRVVAIASGKGGVGKSSVTVNLAAALASRGLTVGVLDADIAGFSIPRLTGVTERLSAVEGKIVPFEKPIGNGVLKIVSMGLVEGSGEDEAIMLRGLMLNRALQHFLEDVRWGSMDYLLIDMPPGTSDIQMGLARMLPRADMLVVTTPALAAQQVAARAVDMARRGYLRVAGVIENMSAFVGEDGHRYALFGEGGGTRLAAKTGVRLLAQVPLDPSVAAAGDSGTPIVLSHPSSPAGLAFDQLAEVLTSEVIPLVEMTGCTSRLLELAARSATSNAGDDSQSA